MGKALEHLGRELRDRVHEALETRALRELLEKALLAPGILRPHRPHMDARALAQDDIGFQLCRVRTHARPDVTGLAARRAPGSAWRRGRRPLRAPSSTHR